MDRQVILMLRDEPVYNITENKVLNKALCPFVDFYDIEKSYVRWRNNRAYLKINRLAEKIIMHSGGKNTKGARRRLSLSDSFWVQYGYDRKNQTAFADVSPYFNEFSQAEIRRGIENSKSTPELTLGGSQPKQWIRDANELTFMKKIEDTDQVHSEMLAVKLAQSCDIPVMNAFIELDSKRIFAKNYNTKVPEGHGTIYIVNMTTPDYSMIPFDQMDIGVLGHNPRNVANAYIKAGVDKDTALTAAVNYIVFDAVTGNFDRETNNSNWAVFMDNRTGERSPSPMYDFNWSNSSTTSDVMIQKIAANIKHDNLRDQAIAHTQLILEKCETLNLNIWQKNANLLLEELKK